MKAVKFTNASSRKLWEQLRGLSSVIPGTVLDSAAKDSELRMFVVAGEVSGDIIGSRLIASLKKLSPLPIRLSGVGGSMMKKEGLESIFPMEELSVMGLWELLPHLYKLRTRLREAVDHAQIFRPHAVVTIDSKGFCFRFLTLLRAKYISKNESYIPMHFHYVAPSFWAWKRGEYRLKTLSKFVDHLLCILPKEDVVCRSHGLSASFVGHPVLEDFYQLDPIMGSQSCHEVEADPKDFRRQYAIPEDALVVSMLPGSRLQEVTRMLPIFRSAAQKLQQSCTNLLTAIHVASNKNVEDYTREFLQTWPVPHVSVPGGNTRVKYDAFGASRAALCTSGTVSLELQLARLPCVVAYRAHFLTEMVMKYKATIPYISLPNILLSSAVIPEALFGKCTSKNLAAMLMEVMSAEVCREKQCSAADSLRELLHPFGRAISHVRRYYGCELPVVLPSEFAALSILHLRKKA